MMIDFNRSSLRAGCFKNGIILAIDLPAPDDAVAVKWIEQNAVNSKAPLGNWGTQAFVAGLRRDGLVAPLGH